MTNGAGKAGPDDRGVAGATVGTGSGAVLDGGQHDVYLVDRDGGAGLSRLLGPIDGLRLHLFSSSQAALLALHSAEHPPALVVSGELTPDLDGISFLSQVRREYPDVVRVLLTDGADRATLVRAVNEAGIYQYVEKPYERDALHLLLRNACERGDLVGTLRRTVRALRSNNEALSAALDQIHRAHERLIESERMAAVGRVASGIAHEIGNQLSVLSYAELIRDRYPDDGEIRLFTAAILSARTRLGGLVGEIRDFSRVHGKPATGPGPGGEEGAERVIPAAVLAEAGPRYALTEESVLLSVQEALSILRFDPAYRLRHVERALDLGEPPPTALLNRDKLVQVIVNLLRNAVDATPAGGEIYVAIEADAQPEGIVAAQTQVPQVRILIEDYGEGIPRDVLPRIFEPFFTTKGERGTGLGLGICRSIVAQHGGELRIESPIADDGRSALIGAQRGPGTRAVIALPRRG
ncbi:MAG TPA: hybrid sensor histidine kinase/response regulator [Pseudomonadota bacterium]|nr:hybrid sensor histidine kinase/response regulator [Pseudomonadota bacterium]